MHARVKVLLWDMNESNEWSLAAQEDAMKLGDSNVAALFNVGTDLLEGSISIPSWIQILSTAPNIVRVPTALERNTHLADLQVQTQKPNMTASTECCLLHSMTEVALSCISCCQRCSVCALRIIGRHINSQSTPSVISAFQQYGI